MDNCLTIPGTDPRYGVDQSDAACNLVISSLTFDLAGTYTCQDEVEQISGSAKLVVITGKCSGVVVRKEVKNMAFALNG